MVWGLENFVGNAYLRALIVLVVVFAVLRIAIFVIEKVLMKFASKTKTDADDIFFAKSSKPFSIIVLLVGLRVAILELGLEAGIESVVANIIWSLATVYGAYIIILVVDLFLFRALGHVVKSRYAAMKDLFSLIKSVVRIVLYVVAFLYILSIWGVEIGPFLAGLGIAGIAVAFALQSTLANIFSGASILLDKSLRVGDVVYLDNGVTKGEVVHIGLRATRVRTFDNEFIIVPNSKVADNNIQNIALPEPKSRVVVPFGVEYGSDIDKVKKVVMKELEKVKHFEKDPEPSIKFLEMGASSLNFKAFFYVKSYENRYAALDEANTKIYNALNKAGIGIPFPQMDIHIKEEANKKKK